MGSTKFSLTRLQYIYLYICGNFLIEFEYDSEIVRTITFERGT